MGGYAVGGRAGILIAVVGLVVGELICNNEHDACTERCESDPLMCPVPGGDK